MRPSSLPMLAACPSFQGDGGNEYTDAGTLRHKSVEALFSGQPMPDRLPPEDEEAVNWAADYIRINAPMSNHPIQFERHVNPMKEDFTPYFQNGGTLDCSCGPHLFDFKSRPRDYRAQMAAYGLGMMQEHGWPAVTVHLLFMVPRKYETYTLTEAECVEIINTVMVEVGSVARPCDYCGWCAKQLTCPAKLEQVNAVVAGRDDWKLEQYHSSEIKTAGEMGKALTLARSLKKWCESVEWAAKEMATKQGITPEGYEIATSKGKSFVKDVAAAFSLAGVPQETFLKCCDLRLNTSKTYPDKVGLIDAYAAQNGMKKTPASKIIKEKLSEVIQSGADGIKLVAVKGGDENEGAE